ncbi:MAG: TVP38/TMEM64 family protein [Peptostreptococcaceae bacterium]|nr:TVP38/TMEM64 family protein [Peptostreptococcaceae bacterium]
MKSKRFKINSMRISSWVGVVLVAIFVIYGYKAGIFSSTEAFRTFVEGFGIWEAFIFIIIQIITVVVPVLPTSVGCIASIVIFGPWFGFLYSYIGICLGSILAFLLSKKHGRNFVMGVVGAKTYDKYIGWIDNQQKFDKMFALAIFFPGAPDDFLCYIAGLTKMRFRKFVLIIILGKPMSIAIYSIGLTTLIYLIFSFAK